jgi:hypothetical protein
MKPLQQQFSVTNLKKGGKNVKQKLSLQFVSNNLSVSESRNNKTA